MLVDVEPSKLKNFGNKNHRIFNTFTNQTIGYIAEFDGQILVRFDSSVTFQVLELTCQKIRTLYEADRRIDLTNF